MASLATKSLSVTRKAIPLCRFVFRTAALNTASSATVSIPLYKNELRVYQILPGGAENDLSKGTDKETQLVVNGIMGCTVDVFNAAIYAGQEQMPNLPGLTDKGLKLLLEEAAGTEELADCYTVVRQRALDAPKHSGRGEIRADAFGRL